MKIDVITPSITSLSGGVGPAVNDLYSNLCALYPDVNVVVKSLNDGGQLPNLHESNNLEYQFFNAFKAKKLGLSPKLLMNALYKSESSLIHSHGLWMATTLYQNLNILLWKKKLVISPHGMLDPWILNQSKNKKRLASILYENYSWKNCHTFHALNGNEADAIKAILPNANVVVIPNGIKVEKINKPKSRCEKKYTNFIFLSRFHKKKNIESLIKAVVSIPDHVYNKSPFKLTLVGWGDEHYVEYINSLINNSSCCDRFIIKGPLFGEEKIKALKAADCFILPSYSEGLPVSVLEAWSYGIPALLTDDCNLRESFSENAAVRITHDYKNIADSILNFSRLDSSEKHKLGLAAFQYVYDNFNWDLICSQFKSLYSDLERA